MRGVHPSALSRKRKTRIADIMMDPNMIIPALLFDGKENSRNVVPYKSNAIQAYQWAQSRASSRRGRALRAKLSCVYEARPKSVAKLETHAIRLGSRPGDVFTIRGTLNHPGPP